MKEQSELREFITEVAGKLEGHERVCTERYRRLDEKQDSVSQSVKDLSTDSTVRFVRIEKKLDEQTKDFNKTMLKVAGAVIGVLVGAAITILINNNVL